MSDTSDIDKLFREGLDPENDPDIYTPSGWTGMARRLDRHERWNRRVTTLKTYGWVAALLLLFFAVWTLLPEKKELPVLQTEVRQDDGKTQQARQKESPAADTGPGSRPVPEVARPVTGPVSRKPSMKHAPEKNKADREWPAMAALKRKGILPGSLPVPERHLELEPVERPMPVTVTPLPFIYSPVVPAKPSLPKWPLSVSLIAAPSYNGVNSLSNAKSGSDFGLLFTVGLTRKWSFSTGAIYAKKLYAIGAGSNYSRSSGNAYAYSAPDWVDADCRVLDVPLNLNYTLINNQKTAVSIGSGVSSYFMLKENYRFSYDGQYDDSKDLELTNENKHWLSVLNFQASYQRKLNSKVSISLQPYLKIPFRDIGYAKIRLQSLGMALGATWNL